MMELGINKRLTATTVGILEVTPFKFELTELSLVSQINDHVRVRILGRLNDHQEAENEKYISDPKVMRIEIKRKAHYDLPAKTFFTGMATKVEVVTRGDANYLLVEAVSDTYQLDRQWRNHSFQNQQLTYQQLFEKVADAKVYPQGVLMNINAEIAKAQLGRFTLQHQETDWEFLKRMASRFNAGLVPSLTGEKICFWAGVFEPVHKFTEAELAPLGYQIGFDQAAYEKLQQNHLSGEQKCQEKDFIYYQLTSYRELAVGDQVTFQGRTLFVAEVKGNLEQGNLVFSYKLLPHEGMLQPLFYNDPIKGRSLPAKVIAVKGDRLKLKLDLDQTQPVEEACWFSQATAYTAGGETGWYAMPEVNDRVNLYFPNREESYAGVLNSLRQPAKAGQKSANKIDSPEKKYFRTKEKQELCLAPKQLSMAYQDDGITLKMSEEGIIEVKSTKGISLEAAGDLILKSQESTMVKAGMGIELKCKESSVLLNGVAVLLKGNSVVTKKVNQQGASEKTQPLKTNTEVKTKTTTKFIWPVHNPIVISGFGWRKAPKLKNGGYGSDNHGGLDILDAHGDLNIIASADGKVVINLFDKYNGNYVKIDHGGGKYTLYCHLAKRSHLVVGKLVKQGEKVGIMGTTGSSAGVHLHFAYKINDKKVNPLDVLPYNKNMPTRYPVVYDQNKNCYINKY